MLDSARRASRQQVIQRVQALSAPSSSVVIGVLRQVEQPPEFPETRVLVEVGYGSAWVVADPGAYVEGGSVYVEVDSLRRPRRVTGPTGSPVPDSTVPTTIEQGALPIVIQPGAMLDQGARDQANDAVRQLSEFFTTSDREPTVADGAGKPEGAYWILRDADGADGARWRWVEGAWVPAPLGPELILSSAVISSLLTNEVFTKNLVLSEEADGWLTRVTARGVEIFGIDGLPLSKYGSFLENALNFYRDGQPVASMSDAGVAYAQRGSFDDLEVGGVDIRELFNQGPRGVVYDRNFPVSRRMTTLGGHSYIVFDVEQGRRYKVTCRVTARNLDSKGVRLTFYHTSANLGQPLPGAPSVGGGNGSTQTAEGRGWNMPGTYSSPAFASLDIDFTYTSPGTVDKTVAILLGAEPFEPIGDGQLEVSSAWWTVEDIGTAGKGSAGSYSTSGGGSSGGGTQPPEEQPKRRYSRTFQSSSWRTFQNVTGNGSGSRTTSVSGPTQGFTPYYPSAGQYASHYYFDTDDIQSRVNGGEIISARVRIKLTHSHAASGGTARLHLHGHSPRDDWGTPVDYLGDKFFAPGDRHWIGAKSQGWATGAVRGIGLWSRGSNSTSYYTRFGVTAELELVWEK